jgi:uncharacterized protein YegJ (DUF2314 family)
MSTFLRLAIAVSLVGLLLPACGGVPEDQRRRLKGESGLSRIQTEALDPEMDAAISEARESLPSFLRAFRLHGRNQTGFAVKKAYRRDQFIEHIWITELRVSAQAFHGTAGNDAVDTVGVSFGDPATVGFSEITDWMYVEDGRLVGGRTIRVVFSRMSAEQKTRFKKEAPFRID